jgi:hypothetical protein
MPGVFEVSRDVPILVAIEDILLINECSRADEWEGQVLIYHSAETELQGATADSGWPLTVFAPSPHSDRDPRR